MNNLVELVETAQALDAEMTDVMGITAKQLQFSDGMLVFNDSDTDYVIKPTKHGLKTMLDLLEINVEGGRSKIAELFNNNITAPAAADMLNSMLQSFNNGDRRMHLRLQGENFVAAFKPDTELVRRTDIVEPFVRNIAIRNMAENAKIVNADLLDNMNIRVLLDDYNGIEHHGAGIEIVHSLITPSRTMISPLVKTTSCNNSLVSNAGFALNNSRGFTTRFSQSVRMVQGIVQSSIETVKQLESLYEVEHDFRKFLHYVKNDKGFRLSDPMIDTLVLGAREREGTLYGQVNGLTYLANRFEGLNFEQRYNLERIAGSIVDNPKNILEYRLNG
jgi:hypothetical protein